MARGQASKQIVMNKLLEVFDGAFLYNNGKEVRIPLQEDGELIQIKVALTAAKENVNQGQDTALPGAAATNEINFEDKSVEQPIVEPTTEERQNVQDLLKSLGL